MATEGNLQAPTRHPLDWENPDFHDEAKCFAELERIFDICHGCRRCVGLCGAFSSSTTASPTSWSRRGAAAVACPGWSWAASGRCRRPRRPTSRCSRAMRARAAPASRPCPRCALMFKQALPLMFPEDADTRLVKEHMGDPFEYLMARRRDGLLRTGFPQPLGKVSDQIPCHGRVQNIGRKTEEMLRLIPGATVPTIGRGSGHAGTYGVKKGSHETAMKIGKPVFKALVTMKDGTPPDVIRSDCPLGGHHIARASRSTAWALPNSTTP